MKKLLQTMYLRYDSASKSLTKRALAQLILKIIYSCDSVATKEAVIAEIGGCLGTNLSNQAIDDAMEILLNEKNIILLKGKYIIEQGKKKKIDIAYNEFVNRQNRIIDKYFSKVSSNQGVLVNWFEETMIAFFKEYNSEWISDLSLTTSTAVRGKYQGIHDILDKTSRAINNIDPKDKAWLKEQFFKFIQSNDPDVFSILWDYGTSCFSSSLITATTSADPISVDEFRNSKCILDTNILMYLDLEGSKYRESFKSMESIFIDLNISPIYFLITRDEFISSMENKKGTILRICKKYVQDVLWEIEDPFVKTALQRGCVTTEDFERYCDQLLDVPKYLYELLEILKYDQPGLDDAIEEGRKNNELINKINAIYKDKRRIEKGKNRLQHDAGLIAGAEFMRKQEKCFILSRDISVMGAALDETKRNEMPIAIGLNTLINVLAIDNGGTNVDPTNYAPLFASIIKLALIPEHDVFKIEDLSRMLDIQEQIADLPSNKIIEIAKELHHNQLVGIPENEISLQLTRSFQSAKLELKSDLDKARKETLFEKTEKEKYIKRSDKATQKLREKIAGELRDSYDSELANNRLMMFLYLPLVTIIITGVLIYLGEQKSHSSFWENQVVGFCINIIAWLATNKLFVNKRVRRKYSERINSINEEVEKRVREALGE